MIIKNIGKCEPPSDNIRPYTTWEILLKLIINDPMAWYGLFLIILALILFGIYHG